MVGSDRTEAARAVVLKAETYDIGIFSEHCSRNGLPVGLGGRAPWVFDLE
jgi:hypothetical protein